MPVSLCGTWDMVSNVNFEGYMIALGKSAFLYPVKWIIAHNSVAKTDKSRFIILYCIILFHLFIVSEIIDPKLCLLTGISQCTRKIALKLKHRKVIEQVEDRYTVKTLSTLRNYTFSFRVNEEFEEFTKGLDGRHCKVSQRFSIILQHIIELLL